MNARLRKEVVNNMAVNMLLLEGANNLLKMTEEDIQNLEGNPLMTKEFIQEVTRKAVDLAKSNFEETARIIQEEFLIQGCINSNNAKKYLSNAIYALEAEGYSEKEILDITGISDEEYFAIMDYKGEYPKLEITSEELGEYYPAASIAAKENPERMEEVRKVTALVDEGKEPYFTMRKDIVEVSKEAIKKSYDYLNCNFDLWEGELSSLEYVPDTLKVLEPYMYTSEGAKVIDVKKDDSSGKVPESDTTQ